MTALLRRLFQCGESLAPTPGHDCILGRFHVGPHYWRDGKSTISVGSWARDRAEECRTAGCRNAGQIEVEGRTLLCPDCADAARAGSEGSRDA